MKIHLFNSEHYRNFLIPPEDIINYTKCGIINENITRNINEVTCKLCLKIYKGDIINGIK